MLMSHFGDPCVLHDKEYEDWFVLTLPWLKHEPWNRKWCGGFGITSYCPYRGRTDKYVILRDRERYTWRLPWQEFANQDWDYNIGLDHLKRFGLLKA